jgi:hypothetical protein
MSVINTGTIEINTYGATKARFFSPITKIFFFKYLILNTASYMNP